MTASTPDQEAVAIAAKLTKGAARACMAATDEWQLPGRQTFTANGAWALHWMRGVGGRGALIEMDRIPCGKHKRDAYRLTPLGLRVRAVLLDMARS